MSYFLKVLQFFYRNIIQKIVAVIIAFIIWILVGNQNPLDRVEFQLTVPISYTNTPNNLVIINEIVESLNIKILVQKRDSNSIKPSNFQVVLDLNSIVEGENNIAIRPSNIRSEVNFRLESFTPQNLLIKTEVSGKRTFPIRLITTGLEQSEKVIDEIKITPSTITMQGPISTIKKLNFIETIPLKLNPLETTIDFVLGLNIPSNLSVLQGPENVSGTVFLGEEGKNIRFNKIAVLPIKSDFKLRINPKTINLLLSGPKNLIDNLNRDNLSIYIDLSNYQPGNYTIKEIENFDFSLPPEIIVKTIWPPIDIWILNEKK